MKNKVKVIAAPAPLTDEELKHYEYWLAVSEACEWLVRTPKDKKLKDIVRDFMGLYAKIKMAMQAVKEGKVNVCIGRSRIAGKSLVIRGEWYDTPEREAAFAMSFFSAYLSSVVSGKAMKGIAKKHKKRIKELEEDLERKEMRIRDLENAVRKSYANAKSRKPVRAKSQDKNRKF